MRRKIDLTEVEAATKIRVRYLRAIENEDWDLLPGDAYARGFVRTYAAYLGLDAERLADELPPRERARPRRATCRRWVAAPAGGAPAAAGLPPRARSSRRWSRRAGRGAGRDRAARGGRRRRSARHAEPATASGDTARRAGEDEHRHQRRRRPAASTLRADRDGRSLGLPARRQGGKPLVDGAVLDEGAEDRAVPVR